MEWVRRLFFRRRRYHDLSVSIQEHLEEKADELIEQGMSRDEAMQAARRAFGNVGLIEERSREEWIWPELDGLRADLKYAARQLRKHPGFALTAILTLTLALRGMERSLHAPLGFQPQGVMLAGTDLTMAGYKEEQFLPVQKRML